MISFRGFHYSCFALLYLPNSLKILYNAEKVGANEIFKQARIKAFAGPRFF
jgi:hypothetical protein